MRPELLALEAAALACQVLACSSGSSQSPVPETSQALQGVGRPAADAGPVIKSEEPDPAPPPVTEARVRALLEERSEALGRRDFERYAALLTEGFQGSLFRVPDPETFDRAGWIKNRREHLREDSNIELEDVEITLSADSALVKCGQLRKRRTYMESGPLKLFIVSEGEHLKIAREHSRIVLIADDNPSGGRDDQEWSEWSEEPQRSNCRPPPGPRRHCVLLDLVHQDQARTQALMARLRGKGYDAWVQGPGLALDLTPRQIRRLFGSRVIYRITARSAGPGDICAAYLRGGQVPARYRSDITTFFIGHQICE
jgi:hypothetical protein